MNDLWPMNRQYERAILMSMEGNSVRRALAGEFLRRIWIEKDALRESYKRLNILETDLRKQYAVELDGTPQYDAKHVNNASRLCK